VIAVAQSASSGAFTPWPLFGQRVSRKSWRARCFDDARRSATGSSEDGAQIDGILEEGRKPDLEVKEKLLQIPVGLSTASRSSATTS